jgi:hypothetical protein
MAKNQDLKISATGGKFDVLEKRHEFAGASYSSTPTNSFSPNTCTRFYGQDSYEISYYQISR